jgi:hypothetical protein
VPTPQRSSFLTGLVSFTGTPTFRADIYGVNLAIDTQPIVRTKRGDVWRRVRQSTPGALLILTGETQYQGFPLPDQFKGATGSVVAKYHNSAQATFAIRVLSSTMGTPSKTGQDKWTVTYTCEVTAYPTLAGFGGTQATVSPTPSYDAAETHEGVAKLVDPDAIDDQDQVRYDLDGLLDTNADEVTRVTALIAQQAATRSGMKVRAAAFNRTDAWGGVVVITLARTTSKEDIENAGTVLVVDPLKLQTGGTVTAVNNSAPTLPSVAGQTIVRRTTSQQEINDGATKYTSELGQRTTREDVTMPGTVAKIDVSGLGSEGQNTAVYDTTAGVPANAASPDSTLQAVATAIQQLNRDESQKVTYFAVNTPAEAWVYEKTRATSDATNLKNVTILGAIFTTGSQPAAPGSSGLVLKNTTAFTVTSPNTSNLGGVLWTYAETTEADDEIFPRSRTRTDANGIKSEKVSGEIVTTAAVLSAPAAPTGLKFIDYTDIPLTDASASNKSLRLYSWGKLDSLDELKLPKQKTTVDANYIEDDAVRTKEWLTSGSAPSAPDDPPTNNVKLITYTDLTITPIIGGTAGLMLRVFLYGPKDSRDEKVLPNTSDDIDPNFLDGRAVRAYLDGESDPGTPSGMVFRNGRILPLTTSLGTNRTLYIKEYATRTRKDDIELLQSRSIAEPGNVRKEEIVVKVLSTATPVTDNTYNPDTTNLEFWTSEVHQVTATATGVILYVHVMTFKPLSPLNEAQESFKQIVDDPVTLLIADDQRRVIDASATTAAPVVTAVNGQAMYCRRRLTTKTGHTLYQHDFWYSFRSVGAELEADKTETTTDAGGLEHAAITAAVWLVSGGAPGAPSAPATPTGLKAVSNKDVELANPLYRLRIYRWGLQTSKDEIEQRATVSEYPAIQIPRRVTASVVSYSGTADALAASLLTSNANASPTTFDGVDVRKLNDTLALQQIAETPNYLIYEINSYSGRQTVNAFLVGGAVYVKLDRIIQRGTTLYDVLIQPQTRIVRRATIVIRRKKSGDPLALNIPKQGLVNSELFLGLPIGEVMYRGPRAVTNLAITGGRGADVADVFEFCSLGWYSEEGVLTGWFDTTADLSSKTDGENVSAATFGWTQAVGTASTAMIDFITP